MGNVKEISVLTIFSVFLVFFLAFVSSTCQPGQIDVNSASLSELDELTGIGPAKAQAIIDTRPFSSVDDLIRVSGIGNVTLSNIKTQGLACVADETVQENETNNTQSENSTGSQDTTATSDKQDKSTNTETKKVSSINSNDIETVSSDSKQPEVPVKAELGMINVTPQAIKSTENFEILDKANYPIYELIAFGALLGFLLLSRYIIKRRKEKLV